MKKALVTGGCGFIGSHIVEQLLQEGYDVKVIDNFSTGRKANLAFLEPNKTLEIIEADIRNFDSIAPHFNDIDFVFHMAALADIVPSIEAPDAYYSTNVTGTFNVLKAALQANITKLVYAASSSCYGIPDSFPTTESAEIRPQYPYALTKYLGEELVKHWDQVYNLPTVSLRLFNVYGPRSRTSGTYGAVFGVFLAQKLAGKPFTIVGDGTQTRDFTYVKDVADAFITAAKSDVTSEIMNVGSGGTYSVNHLV
ncbi:MAG: SDR family NAD(P)-dependent oxidoreductase, partial [Candidatus Cloacimonetes bacterium]|nr:SDR family NAD(P)-dependent oxidoreductase [Candidatus Cloacimonadota bacterium]